MTASRLLALAACALVLLPRPARACSCGGGIVDVLSPQPGDVGVPTNTRIWLGQGGGYCPDELREEIVVIGPGSVEVPLSVQQIEVDAGCVWVHTPEADLAPETRYQVWACDGSICTVIVTGFTTGTGPDGEAPDVPVEVRRRGDRYGGLICGPSTWVDVEVDFEGILVVDIGDSATITPSSPEGYVQVSTDLPAFTVGSGGCYTGWPGGEDETLTIRYGCYDLAGNFSGWSEPDTISLPSGCGCSLPGSPERGAPLAGLLVLLGVLLMALTRRGSGGRP